jgi:sensor histidine kinase regulating citrate/malate metabolism
VRKVIPLDLVETIREGLLVLEPDLTIRFANRSFCQTFAVAPEDTVGRKLYDLGSGQWDIPKLRAALETVISGGVGLIVNELVTNAVQYAFPGESSGTVTVMLKREPGELRLTVADDGKGVDPVRADSGLGGHLVEGFAQQLDGRVERESGSQGTTVRLILPSREDSVSNRRE